MAPRPERRTRQVSARPGTAVPPLRVLEYMLFAGAAISAISVGLACSDGVHPRIRSPRDGGGHDAIERAL
jgi:hypothetical protein